MICETDVFKMDQPLYYIDRYIRTDNAPLKSFNDGSHIIYVNGEIRDDTPLGRLMHDFFCADPKDMHYQNLAELTNFFKNDKGALTTMNNFSYEIFAEGEKHGEKRGEKRGEERAVLSAIKNLIINAKATVDEAMNLLGIPAQDRSRYAALLADS